MLPVTKMNLPAKMGNAFVALGNVTAKMTAATIQMKKVVLVRKSIYNIQCSLGRPKLFKLIICSLIMITVKLHVDKWGKKGMGSNLATLVCNIACGC